MTPKEIQTLKEAAQALEAFEAEKNDPLNAGRTFTEKDKMAYKDRRHYLGLVYYDNNHAAILALVSDNERMRAALKPFAKASMSTQDYPDAAACLRFAFDWHDKQENRTRSATVGDLRNAAKAYKGE